MALPPGVLRRVRIQIVLFRTAGSPGSTGGAQRTRDDEGHFNESRPPRWSASVVKVALKPAIQMSQQLSIQAVNSRRPRADPYRVLIMVYADAGARGLPTPPHTRHAR